MTEPTTGDTAKEPVTYPVKDFIDARQLKSDLAYSPNDLTSAMMNQASMFSHYGVLAADASRQVDVVKMLLEQSEAAVYKLLRDQAAAAGEKVTEAQLEKQVARHSRVISMKKALNEAKRVESIGKTAVESFRHRRDMLVQLGLISREEMKGELRIGERNARDDAMSAQKDLALARIQRKNEAA
jgi:hypothetical protein